MAEVILNTAEQAHNSSNESELWRTRPRVLAQWFQKSRDQWKEKHQQLKKEVKRLKVRVADVQNSREQWRQKAQRSEQELKEMKTQLEELQRQVQDRGETKTPLGRAALSP